MTGATSLVKCKSGVVKGTRIVTRTGTGRWSETTKGVPHWCVYVERCIGLCEFGWYERSPYIGIGPANLVAGAADVRNVV